MSFRLVSLVKELSLFTACLPPPPVILREAEGKVAESIIEKITLVLRERVDLRRWWLGAGEEPFPLPLIRPGGELYPGRRFFYPKRSSGFCNSGQALRAE